MEIGNALPYRKNGFQKLFGSVIPIKSVMDAWAGIFCFLIPFFVLAGCSGFAAHPPPEFGIPNYSGKNSEIRIGSEKKKLPLPKKLLPGIN